MVIDLKNREETIAMLGEDTAEVIYKFVENEKKKTKIKISVKKAAKYVLGCGVIAGVSYAVYNIK